MRLGEYWVGGPNNWAGINRIEVEYGGKVVVFEFDDWIAGPEAITQTKTNWIVEVDLSTGATWLEKFPKVKSDPGPPRWRFIQKPAPKPKPGKTLLEKLIEEMWRLIDEGEMLIAGRDPLDRDFGWLYGPGGPGGLPGGFGPPGSLGEWFVGFAGSGKKKSTRTTTVVATGTTVSQGSKPSDSGETGTAKQDRPDTPEKPEKAPKCTVDLWDPADPYQECSTPNPMADDDGPSGIAVIDATVFQHLAWLGRFIPAPGGPIQALYPDEVPPGADAGGGSLEIIDPLWDPLHYTGHVGGDEGRATGRVSGSFTSPYVEALWPDDADGGGEGGDDISATPFGSPYGEDPGPIVGPDPAAHGGGAAMVDWSKV
jgi:hypothetical protein